MHDDGNISPENLDDTDVLEEIYGISKEKSKENMLYGKDNQFHDMLITPTNEEIFERFLDIPGINEIHDDNVEPLEEVRLV